MPLIQDVLANLESLAPLRLAADWDNVGLLLGDACREARRIVTCLTLTSAVAREAVARQADLIVSHHPVMFKAVKRLTANDSQGRVLLELAAAGIAVYSPHTAWDNAARGINQQLAETLGLDGIRPLQPAPTKDRVQVVVMVPEPNLKTVQEAVWSAGAGVIGEYDKCSFFLTGTGTFLGSDASHPWVGQAGRYEQVPEIRVEFPSSRGRLPAVLKAIRESHPYEEPAYFIYPLQPEPSAIGTGRLGTLSDPLSPADFVAHVQRKLCVPKLQYSLPETPRNVRSVGICCGSGGDLLAAAARAGCDAFVTGEARFHGLLDAQAAGLTLVLAGHYATERPAMERLAELLAEQFPALEIWPSAAEQDPLQWSP